MKILLAPITETRLNQIFKAMAGKRIAVLGDLMLDRYIWGTVHRISPEAPVPVVDMETEQIRLGGAANVAQNIKALGGEPLLVGVVGSDTSGRQLLDIVQESSFSTDGIIVDAARPTTVKTRVIAHSQHVVRIDRELKSDIPAETQRRVIERIQAAIPRVDGIIIEDYNKGVATREVIHQAIQLGHQAGKIVNVDPKFNNFFEYKRVTVFKPNRKEVEEVMGIRLRNKHDIESAGTILLERLQAENILLTLGEQGMSLFERGGGIFHLPTKARHVADVSGAGDTVISTLSMTLAAGATMQEAASMANFAGGIVCGYIGIVPIIPDELRSVMLSDTDHVGAG